MTDLITFDPPKVALIKRMVAKDATDDELELFLHQCRRTGLDPMSKQIYFQKRAGKPVIITGVDGYRLVADRTGKYAGNDDPIFDDEQNVGRATVTVYKMVGGTRCPFTATARWDQYYPGDGAVGTMWRKMPHLMLGKCAETLALRKAFPAELSGVYTHEEMEQAGPADEPVDVTPKPAPRSASIYDHQEAKDNRILAAQLKKAGVPEEFWEDIGRRLHKLPSTELHRIIEEVKKGIPEEVVPF